MIYPLVKSSNKLLQGHRCMVPISPSRSLFCPSSYLSFRTFTSSAMAGQAIYIVSAIHCPSLDGINPHCYSITGAYSTAAAAQTAMLAKAKELYGAPLTHWHGSPKNGKPEWREDPFKVEFKGASGDIGLCWIDERILGAEVVPITKNLQVGRFGMGNGEENECTDEEIERTLCSLLRF